MPTASTANQIPGGGTEASPTMFGAFSTMTIPADTTTAGASSSGGSAMSYIVFRFFG